MTLTSIFLVGIVSLFLLGFAALIWKVKSIEWQTKLSNFAAATPSLLTTVGVFGTFFGILIGLREFDVTQVDASVPQLLEGLKTAFWSSVFGMGAGIIFRIFQPFVGQRNTDNLDDPIDILRGIHEQASAQTQALTGGEDASLLTQIQKFRTSAHDEHLANISTINEGFDRQISAFEKFAEQAAENNSKALIEALNDVIRDFNEKLTEQFGENFKQLNQAVGKLLEWQENYRTHIETTEERVSNIVEQLGVSSSALVDIVKSVETFPAHANAIETVMDGIAKQLGMVGDLASSVSELQDNLKTALPTISDNISELTTNFSTSVVDAAEALKVSAKTTAEQYDKASDNLSEGTERLNAAMEANFETFDKQMEQELRRSLELMGQQLASISGKLAEDYGAIATALGTANTKKGD